MISLEFDEHSRIEEDEEDHDEGEIISTKVAVPTKSANDLWEAYLDGERDMRTAYTMWNSVTESMDHYKSYYQYRLWGTIHQGGSTSVDSNSQKGSSSRKKEHASSSSSKKSTTNIHGNEVVTKLLYEMCKDPHITTYLLLQTIEHGADLKWTSPQGDSVIHLLARNHAHDALQCLLYPSNQIKSSVVNAKGQTPLLLAAMKSFTQTTYTEKQKKTIKLLLAQRDVKINHIDGNGCTTLYYAWKAEDVWLVCKLLRRQASVLSSLSLYAKNIHILFELEQILSQSKDPQVQIRRIKESKQLVLFLSTTDLADNMIDFYNISSSALVVKTLSSSKKSVLTGMLLFRIREELRYLKAADPPKLPEVSEVLAKEKPVETEHRYERDLENRDKFRIEHKLAVKQDVTYKKEKALYQEWDNKRQNHLARLDKEYNPKITGLYV